MNRKKTYVRQPSYDSDCSLESYDSSYERYESMMDEDLFFDGGYGDAFEEDCYESGMDLLYHFPRGCDKATCFCGVRRFICIFTGLYAG